MQHSDFFLPTTSRPVSVLASDVMFPSKWNFRLVYPRSGSRHPLVSFPPSKVQASFAALRHICMYNVYTCWLSRCRNVLYSLYEYLKFCSDTSRVSRKRETCLSSGAISNEHHCNFFSRNSHDLRHLKNNVNVLTFSAGAANDD